MVFLADDDREVAVPDEAGEFGMGHLDEGAGGVGEVVAGLLPSLAVVLGCSMGRDHNLSSGGLGAFKIPVMGPLLGEAGLDQGIVGKLTEHGGGLAGEEGLGGLDGLTNAEAHAEVARNEEVEAGCVDRFHVGPEAGPSMWNDDEEKEKIV